MDDPWRRGSIGRFSVSGAMLIEHATVRLHRSTRWRHVSTIALKFPTYHPQGLVFVGQHAFLSSVQIVENPRRSSHGTRTPGRGAGHLLVVDGTGRLVMDMPLGEEDMYHPGGMDFDGSRIWVSVSEYREQSRSVVLAVDPVSFEVSERFRVPDHVSWVVSDPGDDVIHGGNWGSRRFYTWSADGRELDRWDNTSDFVDYQDCQYLGSGRVVCGGISELPRPDGNGDDRYELGGIAVVDLVSHQTVYETALPLFSSAQHVVTRNPFALTVDTTSLYLHVAPDDGMEANGTELVTYKAATPPMLRPVPACLNE